MHVPEGFHPVLSFFAAIGLVVISGCVPTSRKESAFNDRTATELMETWNRAKSDRDWETWFRCMTPEAREQERNQLLFLYSVLLGSEDSSANASETEEDSNGILGNEETRQLLRHAQQNDRFLVDFMNHMDSLTAASGNEPRQVECSFKFLEKNGSSARAKIYKNGSSSGTVYLKKHDGHWRIITTLGDT